MKFYIALFLVLATSSAFAASVHMVEITSDSAGDAPAQVALNIGLNSKIEGILYQNMPNAEYKNFPLLDLNVNRKALVTKGPVKIVEIGTESITATSIYFYIHYIYEYKLFGSDRRFKKLKMSFVSPLNMFETIDTDTKKSVSHAFFRVNIIKGKEVGIATVDTY